MPLQGIHHLGIAVADLDSAIGRYEQLFGATVEGRETVPDQGTEVATLRIGADRLELLASLGPETPVGRFLSKRGPGMHHVAFSVDDVADELERLQGAGAELVDTQPRRGAFGLEVAFVHPEATGGVLAELVADA